MDGDGFYINFRFNRTHYTQALVNYRCLLYMTISKRLADRLQLPRIKITPRNLQQVNYTAKGVITQVGYANIDIDGHKQKTVYFYIIPGQSDDVILGLPWMDEQDVKLRISKQRMTIRKSGIIVWQRKEGEKKRTLLTEQTVSVFSTFVRRARKDKDIKVFSALLADIEKAL